MCLRPERTQAFNILVAQNYKLGNMLMYKKQ